MMYAKPVPKNADKHRLAPLPYDYEVTLPTVLTNNNDGFIYSRIDIMVNSGCQI